MTIDRDEKSLMGRIDPVRNIMREVLSDRFHNEGRAAPPGPPREGRAAPPGPPRE
jgi:hypothetical protein